MHSTPLQGIRPIGFARIWIPKSPHVVFHVQRVNSVLSKPNNKDNRAEITQTVTVWLFAAELSRLNCFNLAELNPLGVAWSGAAFWDCLRWPLLFDIAENKESNLCWSQEKFPYLMSLIVLTGNTHGINMVYNPIGCAWQGSAGKVLMWNKIDFWYHNIAGSWLACTALNYSVDFSFICSSEKIYSCIHPLSLIVMAIFKGCFQSFAFTCIFSVVIWDGLYTLCWTSFIIDRRTK